jgi:hypothetical protein
MSGAPAPSTDVLGDHCIHSKRWTQFHQESVICGQKVARKDKWKLALWNGRGSRIIQEGSTCFTVPATCITVQLKLELVYIYIHTYIYQLKTAFGTQYRKPFKTKVVGWLSPLIAVKFSIKMSKLPNYTKLTSRALTVQIERQCANH